MIVNVYVYLLYLCSEAILHCKVIIYIYIFNTVWSYDFAWLYNGILYVVYNDKLSFIS